MMNYWNIDIQWEIKTKGNEGIKNEKKRKWVNFEESRFERERFERERFEREKLEIIY